MKRVALALVSVAIFICVGSSAFANAKSVKLDDTQLEGITGGVFDVNYNISPVAVQQNSTVSTSQNAGTSYGYPYYPYGYSSGVNQGVSAVSSNGSFVNINVKQR